MNTPEYLYFVESETGLIKIGISSNLRSRIFALATANAAKIRLIGYVKANLSTIGELERYFHAIFEPDRKHGEWFARSLLLVLCVEYIIHVTDELIDDINSQLDAVYECSSYKNSVRERRISGPRQARERSYDVSRKLITVFLTDYPGSTTKEIAKGMAYTNSRCAGLLKLMERNGEVTKLNRYQGHNKDTWYCTNE